MRKKQPNNQTKKKTEGPKKINQLLSQNDLPKSNQKQLQFLSQRKQQTRDNIKSDLKQCVNSAVKDLGAQIENSIQKLKQQYSPLKQNRQQFNQISEVSDNDDERLFVCDGRFETCKNAFFHLEDYQKHVKKQHKGKVPHGSSHTFNVDSTRYRSQTLSDGPSSNNNKCLDFNTKFSINVFSWNVSSIKTNTLNLVKQNGPHIFCLQESRNNLITSSPSYAIYNQHISSSSKSGGIITGIHKCFTSKNVSNILKLLCDAQFDSLIIIARNEYFDIFIFNFYFNKKSVFSKVKKELNSWFSKFIIAMKPNQIIIICGDFNFKRKPFDLFYEIIPPHIYTFQRKKISTMVKSRTDHILTFPLIESANKYEFNGYSDHCLIKIEFKIQPSTRQQFYFHKFNKVNNLAASKFSDFTCFYNFIKLNLRKSKVILKIKKPIIPKLNYSFEKADLFSKLAQLIKNDKNAFFKLLKTITILNPFKKENSIYSYFIDDSNRLQFGDAAMNNCLEQLSLISKGQQLKSKRLPSLPPLEDFDIFDIQKRMSYNKAITYDGISDNFLRQTKNIHILKNIWNNNTIEINLNCCRARSIPLNKVYPDIPNKSQFRPITILSPLIKFLELRFLPKLQMYLLQNLSKEQTGFLPFSSTQINIINLLNKINNFQKRDKMNCVFIDFSNAFNSIDRDQLFKFQDKNKSQINKKQIFQKFCIKISTTYVHQQIKNIILLMGALGFSTFASFIQYLYGKFLKLAKIVHFI